MARRAARPPAQRTIRLTPLSKQCLKCGARLWVAYHAHRTLMTFRGLVRLTLVVRRCRNAALLSATIRLSRSSSRRRSTSVDACSSPMALGE